jgi:hypothetical protein
MNSLPKASRQALTQDQTNSCTSGTTDSKLVLVREAGVPFHPNLSARDPFTEWLSLMEVVQMLCPAWPVRDRPMTGEQWKL